MFRGSAWRAQSDDVRSALRAHLPKLVQSVAAGRAAGILHMVTDVRSDTDLTVRWHRIRREKKA